MRGVLGDHETGQYGLDEGSDGVGIDGRVADEEPEDDRGEEDVDGRVHTDLRQQPSVVDPPLPDQGSSRHAGHLADVFEEIDTGVAGVCQGHLLSHVSCEGVDGHGCRTLRCMRYPADLAIHDPVSLRIRAHPAPSTDRFRGNECSVRFTRCRRR